MIYTARYERMYGLVAYLTENWCQGVSSDCAPSCTPKPQRSRAKERA